MEEEPFFGLDRTLTAMRLDGWLSGRKPSRWVALKNAFYMRWWKIKYWRPW